MNIRLLVRQDTAALGMDAVDLEKHLAERREQIEALDNKKHDLMRAIDAINSISGRASTGHDKDCDCSYCIIHRVAFSAWTDRG